ncbi:MAG TPA: DNA methyltransferase [Flavobacterium sp.]|jgi:hypothetical protein
MKESSSWNTDKAKELKMHKIHMYPAKFPSFLVSKSLEYARSEGVPTNVIGDIFCGCGTTALEAKVENKQFWGCDINPVATLIARVKRDAYSTTYLNKYYTKVLATFDNSCCQVPSNIAENDRIKYWFLPLQIENISKLLLAIETSVPKGKYRDFFYVCLSNILKRTSKWLTKSIKPQIDPNKPIYCVIDSFKAQYLIMLKAVDQINSKNFKSPRATILNKNFLQVNDSTPFLDMLITSPPYVTSYEYADLHQLSSLWLGFTDDYRKLRSGTIGSLYHHEITEAEIEALDDLAKKTYSDLAIAKAANPKAALKYFVDMRQTIQKSFLLLNPGGLAVFVIGNTTHKNVYIDNAKYLVKCMLNEGFNEVEVKKRQISSKILSPYRNVDGKFSSNKNHKKIYSYEFVLIAKKPI